MKPTENIGKTDAIKLREILIKSIQNLNLSADIKEHKQGYIEVLFKADLLHQKSALEHALKETECVTRFNGLNSVLILNVDPNIVLSPNFYDDFKKHYDANLLPKNMDQVRHSINLLNIEDMHTDNKNGEFRFQSSNIQETAAIATTLQDYGIPVTKKFRFGFPIYIVGEWPDSVDIWEFIDEFKNKYTANLTFIKQEEIAKRFKNRILQLHIPGLKFELQENKNNMSIRLAIPSPPEYWALSEALKQLGFQLNTEGEENIIIPVSTMPKKSWTVGKLFSENLEVYKTKQSLEVAQHPNLDKQPATAGTESKTSSVNKEKKNDSALSKNKADFLLLDKAERKPYSIHANELPVLIAGYHKKHGIRIIKNGETEFGRDKRRIKREKTLKVLEGYKQSQYPYATYVIEHYLKYRGQDPSMTRKYRILPTSNTSFQQYFNEIERIVSPYVDHDDNFRADLTPDDLDLLNRKLSANSDLKALLDKKIKKYVAFLESEDDGLTNDEVVEEVRGIQARMGKDEYVGYVYTSGHHAVAAHFEVLIITKDMVIKPVNWNVVGMHISRYDFKDQQFVEADTNKMFLYKNRGIGFVASAQAGGSECGTLGLIYLKELLKNDSFLLKNLSLLFPYYEGNELRFFFVPPPQVLRYSQVTRFNEILEIMMGDEEKVVKSKNDSATVKPIQSIINETKAKALELNDKTTVQACDQALERFLGLRDQWLTTYQTEVKPKRGEMKNQGDDQNQYLIYHTIKNKRKAKTSKMNNESAQFDTTNNAASSSSTNANFLSSQATRPTFFKKSSPLLQEITDCHKLTLDDEVSINVIRNKLNSIGERIDVVFKPMLDHVVNNSNRKDMSAALKFIQIILFTKSDQKDKYLKAVVDNIQDQALKSLAIILMSDNKQFINKL